MGCAGLVNGISGQKHETRQLSRYGIYWKMGNLWTKAGQNHAEKEQLLVLVVFCKSCNKISQLVNTWGLAH